MNAVLSWTAVACGLAVLAAVAAAAAIARGTRSSARVVPRRLFHIALLTVSAFLVSAGLALLAGPGTGMLVVWLVVALTTALVCLVAPHRTRHAPSAVPPRDLLLERIDDVLARADYQQTSYACVVVDLVDADDVLRGLGLEALLTVRDRLASAVRSAVPPDALVWTDGPGTVAALVRLEEWDREAVQGEAESALGEGAARSGGVVPVLRWTSTTTDERGYVLVELRR